MVAVLVAGPVQAGVKIANPYAPTRQPVFVDFSQGPPVTPTVESSVKFEELDEYVERPVLRREQGTLPAGWVQQGGVVVPQAVAEGAEVRSRLEDFTLKDVGRAQAADEVIGPDADDLCMFPEQTPGGVYTGEFTRGTEFPRQGTIYMNFVGGTMLSGGENSALNQSVLAYSNYSYPVYTGGEEKAVAVAQAVQADFAELAVRVVYLKRPPRMLPYVMIMMGGHYSDTTAGPSGGVAPGADCEDIGMRNVCYAFVNKDATNSQANVASQEIGHTMGLGHTYGNDRVMAFGYDAFSGTDMGFGDECTPVLVAQGQSGYCAGVNKCHCGDDGTLQHDLRTLKAIYAAPGPDIVPPTISITAPPDGTMYAQGEKVTVTLAPEDDFGGYGWQLKLVDANTDEVLAEIVDYEAAQEFSFGGLPDGTYKLIAQIQDHADQVGEDEITIVVGDGLSGSDSDQPTTGASESSGSDGPGGAASSSGDASGDVPTGEPAGESSEGSSGGTAPGQEVDDGCNCATGGDPRVGIGVLVGLLGLRRRRSA